MSSFAASHSAPSGSGHPSLRYLLEESDRFITAVELVTSRGLLSDQEGQRVLARARVLAGSPRIDVLSITDNPAGNAMLAADTLGTDLMSHGQEVIIHLACKDCNRNSLQSRGWNLASEGFDNILALSGDYPSPGYEGMARPSFDIDSVGLLSMYSEMNRGLFDERTKRAMAPTNFFLGAVVTNHKRYEREVVPQYLKLRKKIDNGARFIINQVGYNVRKDDELLRWLSLSGLDVPVISNVYVLSRGAARAFNAGRIPGVVVTDELMALCERQGASFDKGRSFFLELASKQVAVARGLGFRGAYLGGKLEPSDCEEILERADKFAPQDWKEFARDLQFDCPDEFYYFERDPGTGLCSNEVNSTFVASRSRAARRHRARASRSATARAVSPTRPCSTLGPRSSASPGGSTPVLSDARLQPATCSTWPSTRRKSRCSTARTAATARWPRSPICAPSLSARRTSETAPVAEHATAFARSLRGSASGHAPTNASSPMEKRTPCCRARSYSLTTCFAARAPGRTLFSEETTYPAFGPERRT